MTAYLVSGRAAGIAVAGLVLTTVANIYLSAAFGSATFVQPGIGRAHLAGVEGMPALNADTAYGAALTATAAGATLLLIASAIVVGIAIARTHHRLRGGWRGLCSAPPALRCLWFFAADRAVCRRIRGGGRRSASGCSAAADG